MRSGLVVVDKPAGISSRECVNRVQRATRDRKLKIGHAGTLDPMATGVLVIAVGEATKLVEQLHDLDKGYRAQFEFGKSSDTLDREGEVVLHPDLPVPTRAMLEAACVQWTGEVMQQPPRYSAIKIHGERAYDLARRGEDFQPKSRPVRIYALSLTEFAYPHWGMDIQCGSGTYVRSIGRDVAAACGNSAIMTALVRTAVGPFTVAEAHPLDRFESPEDVEACMRSPLEGLPRWPRVLVDTVQIQALRYGQHIQLSSTQVARPAEQMSMMRLARTDSPVMGTAEAIDLQVSDDRLAIDAAGQLIAFIAVLPSGQARPVRVFQTAMATTHPIKTSARHNPES